MTKYQETRLIDVDKPTLCSQQASINIVNQVCDFIRIWMSAKLKQSVKSSSSDGA